MKLPSCLSGWNGQSAVYLTPVFRSFRKSLVTATMSALSRMLRMMSSGIFGIVDKIVCVKPNVRVYARRACVYACPLPLAPALRAIGGMVHGACVCTWVQPRFNPTYPFRGRGGVV